MSTPTEQAHGQAVPVSAGEDDLFPPHPPRADTPEYNATHKLLVETLDTPCETCGVRKSTLTDPAHNLFGAKDIETHHWPLQREYADAVDWRKVAKDFPQVIDQKSLLLFIDSPKNMKVLCLTGDSLVLMADGTEDELAALRPGDHVIGHDLRPHTVRRTLGRHVEEDLVEFAGLRMTANHPVLTLRGWVRADAVCGGESVYVVEVLSPEMFRLAGIDDQILPAVIAPVIVPMVDSFGARELAAQVLFGDPAMLQHTTPFSAVPCPATPIALGVCSKTADAVGAFPGLPVEPDQAAVIRAIGNMASGDLAGRTTEYRAADPTDDIPSPAELLMAAHRATCSRASGIAMRDVDRNNELLATDYAVLNNAHGGLALRARWRPVDHVLRRPFIGKVYDISVEGSRSFFANGVAVHNCDVDHRSSTRGIHHLLANDWAIQKYLLDGYVLVASAKDAAADLAKDQALVDADVPVDARA